MGFVMLFSVHGPILRGSQGETRTAFCSPQETQSNSELTRFGTKAWNVFKNIRWEVSFVFFVLKNNKL